MTEENPWPAVLDGPGFTIVKWAESKLVVCDASSAPELCDTHMKAWPADFVRFNVRVSPVLATALVRREDHGVSTMHL